MAVFDPQRQTLFGYPISAVFFVGIVAFMLISQAFVVIQPGYAGVSITLGKPNDNYLGNGLHVKVPFIENVVPIRTKQVTVSGQADCFSSDLQTVKIAFNALYRIPEEHVVDLYVNYRGDRAYEELLYPRIQDSVKQVAALYRAEDLVKSREQVKLRSTELVRKTLRLKRGYGPDQVIALDIKRAETEAELEALTDNDPKRKKLEATLEQLRAEEKTMLSDTALIDLVDLPISNIDLTDELEKAIEQKQIKEQEALAKRYELDKAKKEAEITVVNATAEAKAVQIKGQALKASPEVIELEIAKRWDGKSPSSVVVGKGGANVMLPLK